MPFANVITSLVVATATLTALAETGPVPANPTDVSWTTVNANGLKISLPRIVATDGTVCQSYIASIAQTPDLSARTFTISEVCTKPLPSKASQ